MKFCLISICAFLATAPLTAATIQVGGGTLSNGIPFNYGPSVSLRDQQIYGASAFSALNQGGGFITDVAFAFAYPGTFAGVVSNVQINLSTTSKAVDGLSTTFAQNVGANDTVVFGPSQVYWNNPGGFFSAAFHLTQPFYYNPANGNLLLDMRIYNSGLPLPPLGSMEMLATGGIGDPLSSLYAFNVNNAAGTANTIGLNTLFTVTPVPEPSTYAIAALAVVGVAALRSFRRGRKATALHR